MSKQVESRVEDLFKNGYKTASPQQLIDSDKVLTLAYLEKYDGVYLTPEQKIAFMNATTLEDITRKSRIVRNKRDALGRKMYQESPGARKGRREKQEQMRREHSPIKSEYAPTHNMNQVVLV